MQKEQRTVHMYELFISVCHPDHLNTFQPGTPHISSTALLEATFHSNHHKCQGKLHIIVPHSVSERNTSVVVTMI